MRSIMIERPDEYSLLLYSTAGKARRRRSAVCGRGDREWVKRGALSMSRFLTFTARHSDVHRGNVGVVEILPWLAKKNCG